MENLSVLYYTSNREKPDFEKRIQNSLLKNCGNLPIISISQKPIKLGTNICVGDIGCSGFNMFRQVQIGLEAAKTKFVISAEADCLYPPDYFTFVPERDNICYRNLNLYVMADQRDYFYYKGGHGATHAQIVGREFYLKKLELLFKDAPQWSTEEKNFPKERWHYQDVFSRFEFYRTENPVVQIKTHFGMRYYTSSERTPIYNLPYWGDSKAFRRRFYHGNHRRNKA